ncbi:BatD family protein, partial [Vibrio genomosp. F10 str. 9ZD137]
VYERGIWPYLTVLFAVLWVVSLGVIIRMKKQANQAEHRNDNVAVSDSSNLEALKQAIGTRDAIKSQFYLSRWLQEQGSLTEDESESIEHYSSKLGSAYAQINHQEISKEEYKTLFSLMKKIEKRQAKAVDTLTKL